jgi:hypothetical protein
VDERIMLISLGTEAMTEKISQFCVFIRGAEKSPLYQAVIPVMLSVGVG